jgi:hypothetical protein
VIITFLHREVRKKAKTNRHLLHLFLVDSSGMTCRWIHRARHRAVFNLSCRDNARAASACSARASHERVRGCGWHLRSNARGGISARPTRAHTHLPIHKKKAVPTSRPQSAVAFVLTTGSAGFRGEWNLPAGECGGSLSFRSRAVFQPGEWRASRMLIIRLRDT